MGSRTAPVPADSLACPLYIPDKVLPGPDLASDLRKLADAIDELYRVIDKPDTVRRCSLLLPPAIFQECLACSSTAATLPVAMVS